jgi:hypothetical protein
MARRATDGGSASSTVRREAPSIGQHFEGRSPAVRRIYDRILTVADGVGRIREEPKKTSIHLVRRTAFAGVATRKDWLILTLKSARDIRNRRIVNREQTSANRWHLQIRLDDPAQVDLELTEWLASAMALAE